jgi:flavorubredoxin
MSELPVETVFKTYITRGLPRMVLPDLWWVGGCTDPRGAPLRNPAAPQRPMNELNHGHCVAYVILGSKKTIMVDPGHFGLWYTIDGQLDKVLGDRPLDYIYVSHQEIPHTGNLGRLMAKYPESIAIGDVRDYHLFHPEVELRRLRHMTHGEGVDLGDRQFLLLDAIWKDLSGTMYGYDTKLKLIYTPDVFEFSHHAEPDVCGTMLHEMSDADIEKVTGGASAGPIFGGRARDQKARVAAFRNLMAKYPIEIITSGHYGPIMGKALKPAMEKTLVAIETNSRGFSFGPPPEPRRS